MYSISPAVKKCFRDLLPSLPVRKWFARRGARGAHTHALQTADTPDEPDVLDGGEAGEEVRVGALASGSSSAPGCC
jgi:hypothetical protein